MEKTIGAALEFASAGARTIDDGKDAALVARLKTAIDRLPGAGPAAQIEYRLLVGILDLIRAEAFRRL